MRESADFRRLWAGSTLSAIGSGLTGFAVPLQVYLLTRSPLAVGLIGMFQMVPTLAVGLLGGSLADAVDRRKLVLVVSCGLAGVSALFAIQAYADLRSVWPLYALISAETGLASISQPARQTFIRRLLPQDKLAAGLALNRLSGQLSLTVGPALGGLIAAAFGLRACYTIDVVTFAASIYGISRLPAMPPQLTTRPGPKAVVEGVRFICRSQVLGGAFLADLNATVFALPVAVFPAINAERFGGDPRTLGLFMTAIGMGGILSIAFSGPLRHISRQGRAMLITVAVWGAAFAGFAVAPSLWLTLGCLGIAGAADTFTVVFRGAIVQKTTPDALRGRVTAADFVVGSGGGQIGNLEAGALGSLTSPMISALAGGLVTVAGSVVIGLALPAFARYRAGRDATGQDDDTRQDDDTGQDVVPPAVAPAPG